ncbi:protocadherin gamma-A11-like isoform X42 [Denticeps clupeoides]|uniref:protocadherin gamma-A11-like isoform X42 n=1 Tax=Denticeps clupeoides TaxID=299321 RepID=UPI0010A59B7E|nr:protocadherin gamma-A11-like isoform X42 [Denticeps clupeoides]
MTKESWRHSWSLSVSILCLFATGSVEGQIRYSIPEEMATGSAVGNVASDLGIEPKRLVSGRARLFSSDGSEYVGLDAEKGELVVKERIDREQLCAETSACSLTFEVILESPMELYRVTVDIVDINDNSPLFPRTEIAQEISESALPGARFSLESALDPDVGVNTLQKYVLHPTDHFTLNVQDRSDGSKNVEMVLKTPLDREMKDRHYLTLTAVDGGTPQRSGAVKIHITVLDANDNAPVFSQSVYKASVRENAAKGTLITTVSAADADADSNANIQYYFEHGSAIVRALFSIEPVSGEVTVAGLIDYEKHKQLKVKVIANDQGGLTNSCEIVIDVIDVNDNAPKITVMSFSSSLPEDAALGTVVAMINVQDLDSGENGRVTCSISRNSPFRISASLTNYYNLLTDSALDRELAPEYNITVTAVDAGKPQLSSEDTLTLKITDVNDHAPQFEQEAYSVYVTENNSPSLSIFTVKALDADCGPNARISYFLDDGNLKGTQLASYVSINTDTGVIYAMKPFDYEQIKSLKVQIKAVDGGLPPLSTNATLNILVRDQNDNSPQVLYPVHSGGSLVAEMVPRAADVGYLVTKVVAVDVDSGQNAWLSYKLQKATDRALFEVGAQNGEIRTARQVTDKDPVKQKLTVVVEDNGQPSRSATVNVNVAVADSFLEVLSEFTDFTYDKEHGDGLTFYLVLALAVVSFLFIVSIITIITVKIYRWRQKRLFYKSPGTLPVIPYYPPLYADGTLQHMYNYEVCGTTDSKRSDAKCSRPYSQSTLVSVSRAETMQRGKRDQEDADVFPVEQKPPSNDWRLPPNQRPGPSGAVAHPEGAPAVTGTGPWPNPPTEAEQLQALMAAANEVSEATATLGPRYNAQYVPDYRQNVYIPGSTATLTTNPQQPPQQALPPPQALPPADAPKAAQTPASKKKSAKKDKK